MSNKDADEWSADRGPLPPEKKSSPIGKSMSVPPSIQVLGQETINNIMDEYLDLLDSSAAVFELNGSYLGSRASSGWCKLLNDTSRESCGTDDEQAAMASGKWHCHESCWKASKTSIERSKPVDIGCLGGIHIYAVPVFSRGNIIGSINFGYSDPPKEERELKIISTRYGIDVDHLKEAAQQHTPRPPFVIDLFKKRLQSAARLIEEMVERKEAETSFQESEARYHALVEHASDGMIVSDETGTIVMWNKGAQKIFGYRADEIIGQPVTVLMPETYRPRQVEGMQRMVKGGEGRHIGITREFEGIRKDDSLFPIDITLSTWQPKTKKLFGAICRDATERKRISEDLERLVEKRTSEIKKKNNELKRFNQLFVGRELRIKELKDKVKALEK